MQEKREKKSRRAPPEVHTNNKKRDGTAGTCKKRGNEPYKSIGAKNEHYSIKKYTFSCICKIYCVILHANLRATYQSQHKLQQK